MVCVNNISLDYNFGFNMSNTECFTAFARNGNSEVSLAVVNPEEKIVTVNGVTGPVTIPGTVQSESGGIVTLALTVKLGPGERLEQSQQNITVSVIDTYDYKVHDPAIASITFNLKDVTYWYELVNDSITGKASWVPADIIPGDSVGNRDGSHNRVFCGLAFWDSTTIPSLNYDPLMGHNGNHALQVTAIDGTASKELYFEEYDAITGTWGNDYDMTVKDGTVYIRNLTLTNVHSSTGTEDYFRYSYLYDSPYNEPTINFTIDDIDNSELEPTYMVYISAWPTAATPTLFAESFVLPAGSFVVDTVFNSPGAKSVNLADFDVNLEHGTYAYEIEIHKYVDNNLVDWFALKWPYCLTIGEHSLYPRMITDDQEAMCIDFEITDACYGNNNHAPYQGGVNITVDAIDYNLNNRGSKTFNNVEVGDSFEGEILANVQGYEEDGLWRSIYTGEDKCWQEYRRDHKGSRMLATNYNEASFPWRMYIYKYNGSPGHISIGYSWYYTNGIAGVWTFGSWPVRPTPVSPARLQVGYLQTGRNNKLHTYQVSILQSKTENDQKLMANDAYSIKIPGKSAAKAMKESIHSSYFLESFAAGILKMRLEEAPTEMQYNDLYFAEEQLKYQWRLGSDYDCVRLAAYIGNKALPGRFPNDKNTAPFIFSSDILSDHTDYIKHYKNGNTQYYTQSAKKYIFADSGVYISGGEIKYCTCVSCSNEITTWIVVATSGNTVTLYKKQNCPCSFCEKMRR